jgi:hypothetical protein
MSLWLDKKLVVMLLRVLKSLAIDNHGTSTSELQLQLDFSNHTYVCGLLCFWTINMVFWNLKPIAVFHPTTRLSLHWKMSPAWSHGLTKRHLQTSRHRGPPLSSRSKAPLNAPAGVEPWRVCCHPRLKCPTDVTSLKHHCPNDFSTTLLKSILSRILKSRVYLSLFLCTWAALLVSSSHKRPQPAGRTGCLMGVDLLQQMLLAQSFEHHRISHSSVPFLAVDRSHADTVSYHISRCMMYPVAV